VPHTHGTRPRCKFWKHLPGRLRRSCNLCKQGVYYGTIPSNRVDAQGRPTAVWVVSRPHNWHPKTTLEQMLEIDLDTGEAPGCSSQYRKLLAPATAALLRPKPPAQASLPVHDRRRAADCQARCALHT
jgi:hypothetical protein